MRRDRTCQNLWEQLSQLNKKTWHEKDFDTCAAVLDRMLALRNSPQSDWRPKPGFAEDSDHVMKEGDVLRDLAWLLACGRGTGSATRAVDMSMELLDMAEVAKKKCLERQGRAEADDNTLKTLMQYANALDTLAAAHARAGDFDAAKRAGKDAVDFAEQLKDERLIKLIEGYKKRLECFTRGEPWDAVE